MVQTQVIRRLGYFLFGVAVQEFLSARGRSSSFNNSKGGSRLLCLLSVVSKTVVCCASAALTAWLPEDITILYTGLGLAAAVRVKDRLAETLPMLCAWLALYLPITGALACLGGGLLVLAADTPELAVPAILVLASMAFLQFGPEGSLVLLGAAALFGFGRGVKRGNPCIVQILPAPKMSDTIIPCDTRNCKTVGCQRKMKNKSAIQG